MKTKLLALALLAGGTMFAQTRFSIGITVGGNNRGYYAQPAPYTYAQSYYDNGYANQGYARAYDHDRDRGFDRDRDRDDDRDRDRGNGRQGYRQQNSYRGEFRER